MKDMCCVSSIRSMPLWRLYLLATTLTFPTTPSRQRRVGSKASTKKEGCHSQTAAHTKVIVSGPALLKAGTSATGKSGPLPRHHGE
jgi:hypothetical protein